MDLASARERSLSCHLALVACRDGHGNSHLVNELMRAVYLSWYLQRAGYGNQPVEQFKIAEYRSRTPWRTLMRRGSGGSRLR
jgi:hypothetical protein